MRLRWVPPREEEGGPGRHRVGEREGRRGGETEGLGESEERESEGERDGVETEREKEEDNKYFGRFT